MNRRKFLKTTVASGMVFSTSAIWAENKYDAFPYPRLWKNQSIDKAIFELFGDVKIVENKEITIQIPDLCENGESVPCRLDSKLDLKRVALFMDTYYSSPYGGERKGLVAIWTIPKGQILNYSFRVEIARTAIFKVVVETRNGEFFYITGKSTATSRGGIGG